MTLKGAGCASFFASLPFKLTGAQERAVKEIYADMTSGNAMMRLVQGDVGSGKTAVAAAAVYLAVKNGCQAAMMAPTEVLAAQHYRSLCSLFAPFGFRVELLSGSLTKSRRLTYTAGSPTARSMLRSARTHSYSKESHISGWGLR